MYDCNTCISTTVSLTPPTANHLHRQQRTPSAVRTKLQTNTTRFSLSVFHWIKHSNIGYCGICLNWSFIDYISLGLSSLRIIQELNIHNNTKMMFFRYLSFIREVSCKYMLCDFIRENMQHLTFQRYIWIHLKDEFTQKGRWCFFKSIKHFLELQSQSALLQYVIG